MSGPATDADCTSKIPALHAAGTTLNHLGSDFCVTYGPGNVAKYTTTASGGRMGTVSVTRDGGAPFKCGAEETLGHCAVRVAAGCEFRESLLDCASRQVKNQSTDPGMLTGWDWEDSSIFDGFDHWRAQIGAKLPGIFTDH